VAEARTTIVFAHANGFPAGVYRLLFEAWREAGCTVLAPPRLGHDPAYPVVSNWRPTCDELLRFIDESGIGGPVHLVGHSMGGYVCLLAACRRPSLAASATLLDAPLVRGWRASTVRAMKLIGLMRRLGPGRISQSRRMQWESREAALAHFAARRAFASWHPRVLADYIDCGTEPVPDASGGGVRLVFRREVETRIYETLPHHFDALLRRHPPRCPVAYVGGTHSNEGQRAGLGGTRALVHERVQWIEGSHLFPMERPAETAAAVLRVVRAAGGLIAA
jgi:pimeloyl-ACP methyl ester carboxylesterase